MIERSKRPVASARLAAEARLLLDASTLCAIATTTPGGDAYVNTAYFAWSPTLRLFWLSDPHARHSQNIAATGTAAVAVYDSTQTWGRADRGIQLFGAARALEDGEAAEAEAAYAARFPAFLQVDLPAYRFYGLRPHRIKLFDERALGEGRFVIAGCNTDGRLAWEATEVYRASP